MDTSTFTITFNRDLWFIVNLYLRIKRTYSLEENFKRYIEELKGWFKAREYPESIINEKVNKFMQKWLLDQPKSKDYGKPLVVTCNPHLPSLERMINKQVYLLNQDDEVRKIFTLSPFMSFKSARRFKESSCLVQNLPISKNCRFY